MASLGWRQLLLMTTGGLIFMPRLPVAAQEATVQGFVEWSDRKGELHPLRGLDVEVRDARTGTILSRAVRTDQDGHYIAQVDVGPQPRNVVVHIPCKSGPAYIRRSFEGNSSYKFVSLKPLRLTPHSTHNVDTIRGSPLSDNNAACAIVEAIGAGWRHVEELSGEHLSSIEVIFPSENDKSYYFDGRMRIASKDRFDWDVILHEYGHYVAMEFDFGAAKGGEHCFHKNLGKTLPKADALALAWSEAWPTYFAVSSLLRLSHHKIPAVGDTRYQDTDNANIDINLATMDRYQSLGEDNEVAIMRVLFDMHDGHKASYDMMELGPQRLWNAVVESKPARLAQLIAHLMNGAPPADIAGYGAVLMEHRISPMAIHPSDGTPAGNSPPSFCWKSGAAPFMGTRYVVRYYDHAWVMLHSSAVLDTTCYIPQQSDWNKVIATPNWPVVWIVQASHPERPETGPYWSQPMRLKAP